MKYYVYIIWSEKIQKYYCGQTNNLDDRLYRHNSGQSKFTSSGVPWILFNSFELESRIESVGLERKIKKRGIGRYLSDIGGKV